MKCFLFSVGYGVKSQLLCSGRLEVLSTSRRLRLHCFHCLVIGYRVMPTAACAGAFHVIVASYREGAGVILVYYLPQPYATVNVHVIMNAKHMAVI
jgi:hypothetical protein